jgi:hypothetical protein
MRCPHLARLVLTLTPVSTLAAQEPCFDGTGGPNGDFDWVVRAGEVFVFDTTATSVTGGPGGIPVATVTFVDGEVEVRDLIIEAGGEVRVQGPNPLRILATRDVIVRGRLDLSGFNAHDVATLNTGNQVEVGAAGAAGGGRGGDANTNTSDHTLRGGSGLGAFGLADGGGQGGEAGVAPPALGKNARRPGGGGGGRFARDQGSPADSLAASAGTDGHPEGLGAETSASPARGGTPGTGPFVDERPENDHFGVRPVIGGRGQITGLVRGEIAAPWAGAGGGGGGNAIPAGTFPNPSWNFASDEKGGAGGGGGGALHVQALGRIVFGAAGEIRNRGGRGATGENTNFLDHVGGTGGAGSGGHVVLESATAIDFTDGGTNLGALPRAWIDARGLPPRAGARTDVDPCCRHLSNGGAGGPGIVQLHVPDPAAQPAADPAATDIIVPHTVAVSRNPLDALADPGAIALFPTCDPFPRGAGWFGPLGAATRARFLGLALPQALDASLLTLPLRF